MKSVRALWRNGCSFCFSLCRLILWWWPKQTNFPDKIACTERKSFRQDIHVYVQTHQSEIKTHALWIMCGPRNRVVRRSVTSWRIWWDKQHRSDCQLPRSSHGYMDCGLDIEIAGARICNVRLERNSNFRIWNVIHLKLRSWVGLASKWSWSGWKMGRKDVLVFATRWFVYSGNLFDFPALASFHACVWNPGWPVGFWLHPARLWWHQNSEKVKLLHPSFCCERGVSADADIRANWRIAVCGVWRVLGWGSLSVGRKEHLGRNENPRENQE